MASDGTPVGRRVVLGMLGLAAVGVAFGSRISSGLSALAERDPTGLTSLVPGTGRFRFYSVAGPVEEVPRPRYRLAVTGAVRRPATFTFDQLAALPQTQLVKDVQCVTGWRVPSVPWSGVLVRDLLAHVGADTTVAGVVFGSYDGVYSETLTMAQAVRDDVLVALSMTAEPIAHAHGGPVRLYVAPMYFYKSLKWLDHITVTDQLTPGYWEQRGYDTDAWVGESNGRSDAPIV